jgi:hypothetical protein
LPRTPRRTEGALELAERLVRDAKSADELRAAQAVLLPLLGHSLADTARAVGKDRYWVSRTRNRVLSGGPLTVQHGGRRRSLLTEEDELDFVLKAVGSSSVSWGKKPRQALREMLDERTPTWADDATVTRLMNRVAPKLFPGIEGADLDRLSTAIRSFWWGARILRSWVSTRSR